MPVSRHLTLYLFNVLLSIPQRKFLVYFPLLCNFYLLPPISRRKIEGIIPSRNAEAEPLRLDGSRRRKAEYSPTTSNHKLRHPPRKRFFRHCARFPIIARRSRGNLFRDYFVASLLVMTQYSHCEQPTGCVAIPSFHRHCEPTKSARQSLRPMKKPYRKRYGFYFVIRFALQSAKPVRALTAPPR